MASWVKDFLAKNKEKKVAKRDRYALHVTEDNKKFTAYFSEIPIHYKDENDNWNPLDTAIVHKKDDWYGAEPIPFEIKLNGQVKVADTGINELTTRVAVFDAKSKRFSNIIDLTENGIIKDNQLVKETDLLIHKITFLETSIKEELILKEKPDFIDDISNKWLVLDTIVDGIDLKNGWITEDINLGKYTLSLPNGQDANGWEAPVKRYALKIKRQQHILTGINFEWLNYAVYPVIIDPDYVSETSDAYIYGNNASYATARSTSYGASSGGATIYVGQRYFSGRGGYEYRVYRVYLAFDTSSLPSGATVEEVYLYLTMGIDYSDDDFNVNICCVDWGDYDPISGSSVEPAYDLLYSIAPDGVWQNTSGLSTNTVYKSEELDTPSWIELNDTTYYALQSANEQKAVAPTGDEYIAICSANHGTAEYRPTLEVNYSLENYPYVEDITETNNSSSSTTHNVSMPATVNTDDLLIVVFANDGGSSVTTPSGWTLIETQLMLGHIRNSVYSKKATGSEDGTTVNFQTASSCVGVAQTYRIRAGTWDEDGGVECTTYATGTSTTPDPPNHSLGTAIEALWIAGYAADRDETISAYPTGYDERQTFTNATGVSIGSAHKYDNVISNNPGTFTISASEQWVAFTIAVRKYSEVETNIETINNLIYASISTFNGLAMASASTVNGLA